MAGAGSAIDARHAQGVQVGAGSVQHNYFGGRLPVAWPCRVGVVPPLADCRQDRPADQALAAASGAGVGVGQVLSGLGGVGKTQVAANLAHRLWVERSVDLLVWITATSQASIITGYAEAAAKVTGIDDPDPEQAAARLLAWLAEPHERRWLVVLDDLSDPDDLTRLWPPVIAGGRTVVTTRRRDAALRAGRHVIDVDVFTPEQAVGYLRDKLAAWPDRQDEVAELAADLGYLPLGLAQAAAYILDRGARMTCGQYRHRLSGQRRRLAELAPHALPDEHAATVAATWSLSIDRADHLAPAGVARPVLELAALLDPNGIPTTLFSTTAVAGYCATRLDRDVDADDTDDAIHLLHRFNLLTVDETTATVRVHRLVQRAVREATGSDDPGLLARTAADALLEIWPEVERDAAHAQTLRANTAALHAAAGTHLWLTEQGGHFVLIQAGHSVGYTGLVAAAIEYFRDLHSTAEQRLGPDHPDTLVARNNVALWRGHAGDAAAAAAAFEELLVDRLRVLGPDHPGTLATRANLAYWRGEVGDAAGAAAAFEVLLADCLRVLGPDHGTTVATRHYLLRWRGATGDAAGAAAGFEELFADRLRVLGPDHPDTLATRANLAYWRGEVGDAAGAAAAFEVLLADQLRVLGPDHPDILATRHSLAYWRGEAGDAAGAAAGFEELFADQLRVFGPDHPYTLTTRHNLTQWRGEAGDPAGAATAFEELLADSVRVLGPDHPHTLDTRNNLAHWHARAQATAAESAN
jgi:hypothetical protein